MGRKYNLSNTDFLKDSGTRRPRRFFNDEGEQPYKVLIVDDDEYIHKITELILRDVIFEGEKLEILSVYSGEEAKELLKHQNDIAVILLDVVMEEEHAGLKVVEYIRNELNNKDVRIIVRTGQPGSAPEEKVVREYDINDYKNKTELTEKSLRTAVFSSLRGYRDILKVRESKNGMEKVITALADIHKYDSYERFIQEILIQLVSVQSSNSYLRDESEVNSGFVTESVKGEHIVIAGIGKYDRCVGKKLKEIEALIGEHYGDFLKEEDNKTIFYENGYLILFKGVKESENFIYMEGDEEAYNQELVEKFLPNLSLVFNKFKVNDAVFDTQKELLDHLSEVAEQKE